MEDECLDVLTYDSYPNFAYCLIEDPKHSDDLNDRNGAKNLTEVRSICRILAYGAAVPAQTDGIHGWKHRLQNRGR